VFGGLGFLFTIAFLMDLGPKRHDNYEYYGSYWWVYCGAGVVGWFIPLIIARILKRLS